MALTPEQRRRIEENRKRALKIRESKMTPSPPQYHQHQQHRQQRDTDNVCDLTQDGDGDDVQMLSSNKKRTYASPPTSASTNHSHAIKKQRAYNSNSQQYPYDDDDIDYEDMEDSLTFQLGMAPVYDGTPQAPYSPSSEDMKESEEEIGDELQMKAIKLASDGENIFLTGRAGTGKSWVTKKIVDKFCKENKIIHVTAPTGIAAINVGGVTINSWGNYHLGQYYDDFDRMWDKNTSEAIRGMDTLLIDEISMLDGHTFDVLECMVTILRCYDHVKDKIPLIKADAGTHHTMSDLLLDLRWDSNSDLGLGDLPPFGGMQLIMVGDFFQLSPVPNGFDVLMLNENLSEGDIELKIGRQGAYAFESIAWRRLGLHTIELTEVHRQVEDDGLLSFLNDMREGAADLETNHHETIHHLKTPMTDNGDGIVPTELHSKNYFVDKRNKDELDKLPADTVELIAVDKVDFDKDYKARFLSKYGMVEMAHMSTSCLLKSEKLPQDARLKMKSDYEELTQYAQKVFFEKDCRVDHRYEVKEDAQVMLVWNLDVKYTKLANGSRGVIKGYFPTAGYKYLIDKEIENRKDDKYLIEKEIESRKDDEKPDDKGAVKDKNNKEKDGNKVKDEPNVKDEPKVKDEPSSKKTNPDDTSKDFDFSGVNSDFVDKVKGFLRNSSGFFLAIEKDDMELISRESNIKLLPFVHFTDVAGKSGVIERFRVIRPQPFSKVFRKVGVATRWQVPLVLAWAISIHKSQGLTIERLLVDLVDCFAVGQAYVACSRGKSIKQMTLKNFKVGEVKTSEKVKKFYRGEVVSSWKDSIVEFDRLAKEEMKKQKEMNTSHNNRPCGNCGRICVVRQIQTNRNNNKGRWYLACPYGAKQGGHTWEFVNTLPLLANNADGPYAAAGGGTVLEMFVPGEKGTIPDTLLGKKFCLTGVFPELGGGSGLKLGKDKMKELIENFGGVVTTSLSGKTDYVITGIQPGAKRLEDAASKGVTALDSAALRNILMGGDLPATKVSAEKKANAITKFFKTSNENDGDAYEV